MSGLSEGATTLPLRPPNTRASAERRPLGVACIRFRGQHFWLILDGRRRGNYSTRFFPLLIAHTMTI